MENGKRKPTIKKILLVASTSGGNDWPTARLADCPEWNDLPTLRPLNRNALSGLDP